MEECQTDGIADARRHLFDISVCWVRLWIACVGTVSRTLAPSCPQDRKYALSTVDPSLFALNNIRKLEEVALEDEKAGTQRGVQRVFVIIVRSTARRLASPCFMSIVS